MKDLITNLQEKYPLLTVPNPGDIIELDDWKPVAVPEEMLELMTEYLVRYAFVCCEHRKGEMGRQKEQNSQAIGFLRSKIRILRFEGQFSMPFYGYTALIKIDYSEKYESEQITFSFINHLNPAAKEAATV